MKAKPSFISFDMNYNLHSSGPLKWYISVVTKFVFYEFGKKLFKIQRVKGFIKTANLMLTLRPLSTRPKSLVIQFEVECAGKLAAVISLFMIHLSANSLRRIYRLMY